MDVDAFPSQEGAIKSVLATTAEVLVSSVQLQSASRIIDAPTLPPSSPPSAAM
jgi:hypothetical protein